MEPAGARNYGSFLSTGRDSEDITDRAISADLHGMTEKILVQNAAQGAAQLLNQQGLRSSVQDADGRRFVYVPCWTSGREDKRLIRHQLDEQVERKLRKTRMPEEELQEDINKKEKRVLSLIPLSHTSGSSSTVVATADTTGQEFGDMGTPHSSSASFQALQLQHEPLLRSDTSVVTPTLRAAKTPNLVVPKARLDLDGGEDPDKRDGGESDELASGMRAIDLDGDLLSGGGDFLENEKDDVGLTDVGMTATVVEDEKQVGEESSLKLASNLLKSFLDNKTQRKMGEVCRSDLLRVDDWDAEWRSGERGEEMALAYFKRHLIPALLITEMQTQLRYSDNTRGERWQEVRSMFAENPDPRAIVKALPFYAPRLTAEEEQEENTWNAFPFRAGGLGVAVGRPVGSEVVLSSFHRPPREITNLEKYSANSMQGFVEMIQAGRAHYIRDPIADDQLSDDYWAASPWPELADSGIEVDGFGLQVLPRGLTWKTMPYWRGVLWRLREAMRGVEQQPSEEERRKLKLKISVVERALRPALFDEHRRFFSSLPFYFECDVHENGLGGRGVINWVHAAPVSSVAAQEESPQKAKAYEVPGPDWEARRGLFYTQFEREIIWRAFVDAAVLRADSDDLLKKDRVWKARRLQALWQARAHYNHTRAMPSPMPRELQAEVARRFGKSSWGRNPTPVLASLIADAADFVDLAPHLMPVKLVMDVEAMAVLLPKTSATKALSDEEKVPPKNYALSSEQDPGTTDNDKEQLNAEFVDNQVLPVLRKLFSNALDLAKESNHTSGYAISSKAGAAQGKKSHFRVGGAPLAPHLIGQDFDRSAGALLSVSNLEERNPSPHLVQLQQIVAEKRAQEALAHAAQAQPEHHSWTSRWRNYSEHDWTSKSERNSEHRWTPKWRNYN
ncbi:unnamed protein product [Amoebophrya sp. A25]|nr:unnamed protein product [Amoebophrya sp. A25]|eukprot:GSA25T00022695001.1